ncbi:MAG: heavy metal translocating P-type ATPase [Burkholderiaceae bacterium]
MGHAEITEQIVAESAPALRLQVTGMHCGSCVGRVETILRGFTGVNDASVNLVSGEAIVMTADTQLRASDLASALTAAGYETTVSKPRVVINKSAAPKERWLASERLNLLIAVLLTIPVFLVEMGSHFSPAFSHWVTSIAGEQNIRWAQLLLSAIVLFYAGREFFSIGVPALLRLAPEMNTLVALGGSAAWIFSAVATIAPQWLPAGGRHIYFEAAAVIVTLILLGRYLESRARRLTSKAIDALASLQPLVAQVRRGEQFVEVPIEQVTTSDQLQVRPGERIAVDGTIVTGTANIDESMLTGESVPVVRRENDTVSAGTINLSGSLIVQATAVGNDTTLASIINQVWDAQNTKLPIQAVVDKIAMWFVPIVMVLSVLTFAVWMAIDNSGAGLSQALVHAIAVLIVACPCAMGLATPLSVMVGTGRAARAGLLFRHGDALQQMGKVKAIGFDKTGTLTQGQPDVTEVTAYANHTADELVSLLASVEQFSEHPLAQAVVRAAQVRGLPVSPATKFESVSGMGVRAVVGDQRIIAGNLMLMKSAGIDTGNADLDKQSNTGQTVFLVAVDDQLAGAIAVADPIRPEAAETIASLHRRGIRTVMVSGDRQQTAQAVGDALGIDEVRGDVMPADKRQAVLELREKYGIVAFVGDGINDAPALAEADIGIAIGSGTDVAIDAADLVIASNRLSAVTDSLDVSVSTMRNIKQNLFWAFIYNLLLIPVAAGVLSFTGIHLSPMLAAGAMSLSSLFVVFNALRLNKHPMQSAPTGEPI